MKPHKKGHRALVLCVVFLLLSLCINGCATKQKETKVTLPCPTLWLYAPDALIVELAAGETVSVNPALWDFPLFCSTEEAEQALQSAQASLPKGKWAFYTISPLKGSGLALEDLLEERDGKLYLKHQAALVHWKKRVSGAHR